MRDRLIELIAKSNLVLVDGGIHPDTHKAQEALADYLIANYVIVAPCDIGDTVYVLTEGGTIEKGVTNIIYKNRWCTEPTVCARFVDYHNTENEGHLYIPFSDFGKTVFLTKEEAENALAERSKK